MNAEHPGGLFPSLSILADELAALGVPVTARIRDGHARFSGIRLYRGQPLLPGLLYLLSPESSRDFPVDEVPYLSVDTVPGAADHLCCPGAETMALLEQVQGLFDFFQRSANQINALIYQGASLDDLCELGEQILGNPLFIHDNWFLIIGRSHSSDVIMPRSGLPWELVPQWILDEFRVDVEYQKTYQHRHAALWRDYSRGDPYETIYVNIYDGDVYQGRLLLMSNGSPFRKRDYLVSELLAQQALVLIKAKRGVKPPGSRSTDDILWDILCGKRTESAEFSVFLNTLQWEKTDRFLCARIRRQEPIKTDAMEAVLHRELFLAIPGSYIMVISGQQCVVVNLTKTPLSMGEVRHALSPLCRDYYQYAGISSPVTGMQDLKVAYHQAGVALEQVFQRRDERWLLYFHDCALKYMMMQFSAPMQLSHLVAPQLMRLLEYDREKDGQYFETFRVYLEHERDIPRTAQALIIHRTTLQYRLKKIRALVEMDLDDPDTRLYLLLSLKILEEGKTLELQ